MKRRTFLAALSFAALAQAAGSQAAARTIAFVACPIIRDTKTVPCWLSEYKGQLYYLTIQTDISAAVHPPYLGHKVLVEGRVGDRQICGGQAIEDVHLSPLPDLSPECNKMLPREERYDLPFDPPRPPGPSGGTLAFVDLPGPPPGKEAPSTGMRTFDIPFRFDAVLGSTHAQHLIPPFDYARKIGARVIQVTGFRGAALLDDGTVYREREAIGADRAAQVAASLKGAGLKADFTVGTEEAPAPNGIDDFKHRIVRVTVIP